MVTVHPYPLARTSGLLVEELRDETLVYDLGSHTAHCLNRPAATVWRLADGTRSVPDLASALAAEGLPSEEAVVWLALDRLRKAELLEEDDLLGTAVGQGITRKEVLRILGAAAAMTVLMPAVETMAAPQAGQAASCVAANDCVMSRAPRCSEGLPICTARQSCCKRQGQGRDQSCIPQLC